MNDFLEEIKNTINKRLNPEEILAIDNSSLHAKHKSFDARKFHIKLIIKSKKLKKMSLVAAHKLIFSMPDAFLPGGTRQKSLLIKGLSMGSLSLIQLADQNQLQLKIVNQFSQTVLL